MKKIILITPKLDNNGGVASFYNKLKVHQLDWIYHIEVGNYNYFGLLDFFRDLLYIKKILSSGQVNKVIFNPSFRIKSVLRDGCFIKATSKDVKKVVFWHGWSDELKDRICSNKIYLKIFRRIFSHVFGYIFLGQTFKDDYNDLLKIESINCHLETMPVESDYFLEKPNMDFKGEVRVLFLSRLVEGKGVKILLETIAYLNNNSSNNYHFDIVGSGKLDNWLHKFVEENVLNAIVTIHGDIRGEEKKRIYYKNEVFVLPTLTEGFPNVIAEAMSCGLAIITRPVGAISEHVKNNVNGFLLESLDPKDFAEKLEIMAKSKELKNTFRSNNREYALANFDIEVRRKKLIDFITEI